MKKIRIGSRESKLAVAQTRLVIEKLKECHPELEIELVTMKTTGDKILDRSLDKIGGKGLFVKELDRALLDGRIDIAVHSLKDMPMELPEELPILAYYEREDERDVLILPDGKTAWDGQGVIGCSSLRRTLQLKKLYPCASVKGVRGNILTRLEKLDRGEFDAIVLAAAGLKRLHLEERIYRTFTVEEMLPAAGQGILAVQGRREMLPVVKCIGDVRSSLTAETERAYVRYLDGGCSSPVAAHAETDGSRVKLTGLYYDKETMRYCIGSREASAEEAARLGVELADELRKQLQGH